MKQVLPIVAALLVIGVGTYLQGKWTDRWSASSSETLDGFTAAISQVPTSIGDWVGADTEIDEQQFKASHCTGCVARIYRNRETGEEVSVFLVCGSARHVTIHTPDWCYQGAGFTMEAEPFPYTIDSAAAMPSAEFSTTVFTKEDALGKQQLRIFWAYSDDGQWTAPRWPKPTFAGRPALYKIYLITPVSDAARLPESSASVDFVRDALPAINKALFPSNAQATVGEEA